MKYRNIALFVVAATFLLPGIALAQEAPPGTISAADLSIWQIISTILYGIIGIGLSVAGYFAFDKIAGLNLQYELVEDQNMAIGIMLAGVFIGIAIVVGAVMLS